MAKITKLCVGESLIGDGNEVAHIDLLIGPRGGAAETAFANAFIWASHKAAQRSASDRLERSSR